MRALLDLFLDICLFRKGPQDIPWSWPLLKLSLLANALVSAGGLSLMVPVGTALAQTLLGLGLLVGLTYGVLQLTGHASRFVQTLTALAGTDTLLGLIALPLALWLSRAVDGSAAALPLLLFWLLMGWSIAITTHILHHALSVPRGMALLYTLGYVVLSRSVLAWLLPGGA